MNKKQGQVYKIHSDFYYVKKDNEIIECKIREVLKKQKQQIAVGDFVEIEENSIIKIEKRKSLIKRPYVANIDQLLIVSAIKEPDLSFTQLNRYLIFAKINNIDAIICFNKEDLSKDDLLDEEIKSIYEPLGYKVLFTSALEKTGLEDLKKEMKGKLTALCGQSGVGKSSILNALGENLNLRTKEVSQKLSRGVHTTRHSEILDFGDYKIMDTPGFSCLKFDFILPYELGNYFDEIKQYRDKCKFKDCMHTIESKECAVVENLDKINVSRYESYLEFLKETLEYKEKISKISIKKEYAHKNNLGKEMVKISSKKRETSRKVQKQRIKNDNDI
ncbi:MAG: ribosome small subunit-dependent GTPase A [Cyanobacteria bacterium SIG30]|nr:ribosome small subunit-dependent GTPase A [Cyanobacteria bacterium SIG30]